MVRKDKKSRQCISCGKTLASPQKLRQHYQSRKNQCTPNLTFQIQVNDQDLKAVPATQVTIQQVIDQEKKYASEKHFRSIYKVEDGIVEEEPPQEI